jgi:hypothetical protein
VPVRGAGRGCWLVEPSTRPSRPVFVPGVGAARAGAPGGAVGAGSGHTVGVLKNQAPPPVWLVRWAGGWGGSGCFWLFGISIVDASIFVVFVVCWFVSGSVASYEGHMVDALASRADEGRRSLR